MSVKNKKFFIWMGILGYLSLTPFMHALDLRSALYEMSKTDPAILAKQKELEAARHELDLAKSGYYPKLDIQGSIGNEKAKSQLTQYQEKSWSSNNAGVTLTQNVFAGFATKYDVATKEHKIKAREYALIEQANDSALRLSKSYLDLLRAYELLLIEADNVKTHEKIFNNIKVRTEGEAGESLILWRSLQSSHWRMPIFCLKITITMMLWPIFIKR